MPDVDALQERKRDVARQEKKLERKIKQRAEHLVELRKAQEADRRKVKSARERERELESAIAKARQDNAWTHRACLDGATTWLGLKLCVVTIAAKTSWEGTLVAADRTSHADDCGDKLSQAELWHLFQTGQGNPANPPGTSSHEGVNGGNGGSPVTDKVPVGANLPHFMWGIDIGGDGEAFEAGAKHLGFVVRQMPTESWHFNFMADPTAALKKLGVL